MAHLTDMAGEPPPDWSRFTVTVFVDTGLRTFSYSAHSLLPRIAQEKRSAAAPGATTLEAASEAIANPKTLVS